MRAAVNQAKNAEIGAGAQAGQYESAAQSSEQQLQPFLSKELNNEHGYSPDQLNQLLTAAGAGSGGATGALTEQDTLDAARTNNTGATSSVLDSAMRDKSKALAGASEGVATQDVNMAKQRQQQAAGGLGDLTNMNTDAALKSMGLQTGNINAEVEGGKSGWFQNMTGLISSIGQLAGGFTHGGK